MLKKYKVIIQQTETFTIKVEAEDEQEADDKATIMFGDGEYQENDDCQALNISVEEIK